MYAVEEFIYTIKSETYSILHVVCQTGMSYVKVIVRVVSSPFSNKCI